MAVLADENGNWKHITSNAFELPAVSRKRVVSVKLEETLLALLDEVWRSLGYQNRSQFIREAIVWYMMIVRSANRGLCICECDKPGAKRIEEVLAEETESE